MRGFQISDGALILCPAGERRQLHDDPSHGSHRDLRLCTMAGDLSQAGDIVQIFDTGKGMRLFVAADRRFWVSDPQP